MLAATDYAATRDTKLSLVVMVIGYYLGFITGLVFLVLQRAYEHLPVIVQPTTD
jgi:hypothetical protein